MKAKAFILLVCLVAGCTRKPEVVKKVFGGQQLLGSFLAANNVTAQRLHLHASPQNFWKLDDYDKDPPMQVPHAQIQEVRRLIQQPSSYVWSSVKGCLPDYGVLLTFRDGQRAVRIALYFECNMLGVFDGDNDHAASINDESDFDPIRPQLVAVVKAIFPNYSVIQNLKSNL